MPESQLADAPTLTAVANIRFAVVVRATWQPEAPVSREALLPITEQALYSLLTTCLSDAVRALQRLSADPVLGRHDQFPELGAAQSRSIVLPPVAVWLRDASSGTFSPTTLASWHFAGTDLAPAEFIVEEIEFLDGSLTTTIKGVVAGLTMFAAVAVTPPVLDAWNSHTITEAVQVIAGDSRCAATGDLTIDADALRLAGPSMFNYEALGLTEGEKRERACLVQLVLLLSESDPGPIDGDPRSLTLAAQKRFAIKHGLTSWDIRGEQFRASLVMELHAKLNALKR